jgi:hypothetical protein
MKPRPPRPLTANQQTIVDAVKAGAKIVKVEWTQTSARGSAVNMWRRKRTELRNLDGSVTPLREDSVDRLVKRGLVTFETEDQDNIIGDFVEAVRNDDVAAANKAVARGVAKTYGG